MEKLTDSLVYKRECYTVVLSTVEERNPEHTGVTDYVGGRRGKVGDKR